VNLDRYLARRQRVIQGALEQYFPPAETHLHRLNEAVRYSLIGGGKRLRPILLIAAAEAVEGESADVLPFACAVEMIHTYALIHDDLPAMDDDSLRRGKPTNHVVFGEGLAILAGDALLTESFRIMAQRCESGRSRSRAVRAMTEVAEAAGPRGMVGGQAADLEAEKTTPDLPTVEFIHVRKTGALIRASIRSGAILAGAGTKALRSLTRYGEQLGVAFQVADDILDAEAPTSVTGKVQGRDGVLEKVTYPAVLGLAEAKRRAAELLDGALAELAAFSKSAEPLRQIARFIVGRAAEVRRR
jgi:geranylgeranyl diphosphate synthase type II